MELQTARLLLPVLLTVCLGACAAGFKATFDHDPSQDFSGYRTYSWISEHPMIVGSTTRIPSPLLEPRIMAAVEDGMRARGFTKASSAKSADFVLSFTVGSREEIRIDSYPSMYSSYGYARGRWGGAYYGVGTETSVRQYQKGMLALDVFDVAEHRPVWHGVATKSISESDRNKLDETVRAAVDAILQNFPPQ